MSQQLDQLGCRAHGARLVRPRAEVRVDAPNQVWGRVRDRDRVRDRKRVRGRGTVWVDAQHEVREKALTLSLTLSLSLPLTLAHSMMCASRARAWPSLASHRACSSSAHAVAVSKTLGTPG